MNRRAAMSGFLGATSSLLAKLAFDPSSPIVPSTSSSSSLSLFEMNELIPFLLMFLPRGVCLLVMVGFNAVMISTFLDGMDESGSVAATAISNASNFMFSAMFGILFFNESVNVIWAAGFIMIISGVWLLSTVKLEEAPLKND
mmetsp:Transcript_48247/g.58399  ORF Transcript_48247/g.58399 Transcript_48247/m.58399 type:complete len:143 (-) Transcript_48247:35-463(-)